MTTETAFRCIDWIFSNIPDYVGGGVALNFTCGEPLLEYELLKEIFTYTCSQYPDEKKSFFATTNGTLLNSDMKNWFTGHKNQTTTTSSGGLESAL
jgi:sulfatase maturation enzyme AslB (radical SAM superfamily)